MALIQQAFLRRKALISIGRTLIDLVSPTLLKPSPQHRIWLVDMVWEA